MTSPDPASTLQQPQFWSSYPARLREGSTALLQTTAVSARPIRRAAQRETNIMAFDSDDEEFERQLGSMASTITLPSQQTTAPKQLAKKAVRPTNHAYPQVIFILISQLYSVDPKKNFVNKQKSKKSLFQ